MLRALLYLIACCAFVAAVRSASAAAPVLPPGVRAVWDLDKAYREKTATRERVCLNGLWRWQPARDAGEAVPAAQWGYFKVPGPWPGITDYMEKDCQTVFPDPAWKGERLASVTSAWYQRQISVPAEWKGRRVALSSEYLNSLAAVYVDGRKAGELRFPGGELDLTSLCRPGGTYQLSMLVTALPLQAVMLSYTDTASARQVKGTVERRGLCGDVYLVGTPPAARLEDVSIRTSVRSGTVSVDATPEALAGASYSLRTRILDGTRVAHQFTSPAVTTAALHKGRFTASDKWKPAKLWDLNTPRNMLTAEVSLLDGKGRVLDTALPVPFGFREFRIQGRDFYLNGSRIHLRAVPLDSAAVGAAWATYDGARETLQRLKSFGINFVYTHNYGCEPGSHLSFAEILRAADDEGMLVALSQPHFSHYDWRAPDADRTNGYARHAAFYVRVAENHPSVVAYSMSHNANGYGEDMNPDMIDGVTDPRTGGEQRNAQLSLRAEAIVKRMDPDRIVYHHSSGNLGSMWTDNFYANFTPIQEMDDWFEHWATKGVKPAFMVEYGVPFSWDWGMYRGWYQGQREWGSAVVPWEFCQAEWNAQFMGDRAYRISDAEKANLRWEAGQFRAGRVWHRWDYPHQLGSSEFDDRNEVFARYLTSNWRAYRTWGVSAISPWEHAMFWRLRPGADRGRKELKTDWDRIQRPGFSADYTGDQYDAMELSYGRSDWVPTAAGEAVIRNNRALLAYIGGKDAALTSKDHNFLPGEAVEKQLIVINDSRAPVSAACRWSLSLPRAAAESKQVRVAPGDQVRVPLRFSLPQSLPPGRYEISASVRFGAAETQTDSFAVNVLSPPPAVSSSARIALFDPQGETGKLLTAMGVRYQAVDAAADLGGYDLLIVGKKALTLNSPAPDIHRVREGLKVVLFEQSSEVLEQRFGFRVAEYGLRQLFARVPNHPLLAGLDPAALHDWRGNATLLPPRLAYTMRPRYGPTVKWAGIDVTRVWRCGCRGNVASVLIEKPACGDFLPVVDGGYAMQYSPLLEYHEGRGVVLFCQMDVSGRTEEDPAANRLARNIVRYVQEWKPGPERKAFFAGGADARKELLLAGFMLPPYGGEELTPDTVLVVGTGGGRELAARAPAIGEWLRAGGHLLGLGLDEADVSALLPSRATVRSAEHIAAFFPAADAGSRLAGLGPADVHNRDPMPMALVTGSGAVGDGVLAKVAGADAVLSAMAPWQFDPVKPMNRKRTFRRSAFLAARLASNMGVPSATPLLARFGTPPENADEKRWLKGFYLDTPEEWDDPYRFFRW